jgi:microcystin degradation protein MlrC
VIIAGLFNETHTFINGITRLEDCQVLRGDEMFQACGDASPLGGALDTARKLGWHIVPSIDVRAMPGPTVSDDVVETWWQAVQNTVNSQDPLDGIFLILHGAMVSQSLSDVEGEMLARLRSLIGLDVPIGGVTDLHANFSARMASNSNALITYRENPHTDARAAAKRAVVLLHQVMNSGQRATTVWQQTPILWPPTGTATAADPMRALEQMAREIETLTGNILAVNVHAGYSFADVHDAGVSFSAVTIGPSQSALLALQHLAKVAWQKRDEGNVTETDFASQWPAIQAALNGPGGGPIVIAEPADNIGGGAPGNGTGLLRALIAHQVGPCAVVLNDPLSVARLHALKLGERFTLSLGGASEIAGAGPLELHVELISLSDGRFTLEDSHSHLASMRGLHIDMGPCATVRHRLPNGSEVFILLTSCATAPFDLGQLRSQGIVPEAMAAIGVKAAVAHRRAYDPIARASFSVATPGICSSDLKNLPFKNVRRPLFPLDEFPL